MHPPNSLFALVLVAALGVKAASAQPALGAQVRRASLTGCSNGWYLRPILRPRRAVLFCCPARDRFRSP